MISLHPNKAEAISAALASGMESDEDNSGFTVVICNCDAVEPSSEQMESCSKCERMVISPGGTA